MHVIRVELPKQQNETYLDALKKVLGARFMRTIKNAVLESFNSGISWLYPYYDRTGQLAFKLFPGYEILPFWADAEHTVLDAAIRLYQVEVYYASKKKIIEKADVFKPDGVATYIFENGKLTPDSTKQSYITLTDASGNTVGGGLFLGCGRLGRGNLFCRNDDDLYG